MQHTKQQDKTGEDREVEEIAPAAIARSDGAA